MARKTIGNGQRRTNASNAIEAVAPFRETSVMRGRRPVHTPELAQHVLDQLSFGRSLRAVCRDDGMPSLNTVLKWVRDDREGFAARYRQALRIGNAPRGRPSLYTDEIADRILVELLDGRRLCEICADPGMPSAAAVKLWVMEDRNGFAARYRRIRDICAVGMGRPTLYTPALADLILDELSRGRTLADVCRDPDMARRGHRAAMGDRESRGFCRALRYRPRGGRRRHGASDARYRRQPAPRLDPVLQAEWRDRDDPRP
jgi:hypothetical protein